mgnify:CR=1 FL=1
MKKKRGERMKLFKNRGDIYLPKTDYKSSKEERILRILLIVIVLFTVVFLVLLNHKYTSMADFFGRGEITVTDAADVSEEVLPDIAGKTNFLFFETDDERTVLHYVFLIQADRDNLAYKVTALSPSTKLDGDSLFDIYSLGGGAALQTRLTEYFGFEIGYYAGFEYSDFIDFAGKLGDFVHLSGQDIRFSGGKGDDKYTLHINEGEQSLGGKELSNLLRYYCEEEKNFSLENEALLEGLTQLFNEENYEDCDSLFRLFIQCASTNITVRDFENGKDGLYVFCKENSSVTLYSTAVQYKDATLTPTSVKDIKGYFSY